MSGKILRKLREEKGMTQAELAKKLHVVRQTVSKWERELSAPDAGLLLRLAEALDVPASFLLGEEERVTEKRCMQCPTEEAEGSQASEIWHKPHGVPQKSGEVPAMQPSVEAEKESVQMPCDTRQELAAQLSCLQKAYARDCERRRRAVRTACTVFFVLATVIAVCTLVSAWYTRDMTEALLHTPGCPCRSVCVVYNTTGVDLDCRRGGGRDICGRYLPDPQEKNERSGGNSRRCMANRAHKKWGNRENTE